jgi:hypothetical protein
LIPITGNAGHEVCVAAYGHGAVRFQENGVKFHTVEPVHSGCCRFLEDERPDFIITSATSLPERDMSERYLWRHAGRMGIGSLAFIDQWQNYAIRFRGAGDSPEFSFLPDHVNCIDGIGRTEMLAEGFPAERLVAFGLPQLAELSSRCRAVDLGKALGILGIPPALHRPERTLLFVSEPLAEYYGSIRGYDQYLVLQLFLEAVRRHCPEEKIIVKLHPKDNRQRFNALEDRFSGLDIHFIQNEITHIESLRLADRVFGMTSVMLVEAYLLGKVTVSIQPGLKGDDHLVLTRLSLVPLVKDSLEWDPLAFTPPVKAGLRIDFDRLGYLEFLARRTKRSDS